MTLEAMSASVACALTDTGAEFAVDKETALVVPLRDDLAMINAVDLLIQDVELRTKLGTQGYSIAEAASNSDNLLDNLEQVIKEVGSV